MTNARQVIDDAFEDNAADMRAALHAAIQEKISAALEDKKIELAQALVTTESKVEPDAPDADRVAKRKALQALKDKQEDERAEKAEKGESSSRTVKGKAYGGSAQKDDEDDEE